MVRPTFPVVMAAAFFAAGSLAGSVRADIIISEVDPSGSSSTSNTYNADWFELTNTGASPVNISGWAMDDNSHTATLAVPLRGVSSIAPGQSVVFLEGAADGSTDGTIDAAFEAFWFGANIPAGFTIGNYGGAGVGLSTSADEVNIYTGNTAGSSEIVGVGFGATTTGVSLDNVAGLGNTTQPDTLISTNSVAGVDGAFSSINANGVNPHEVGSPGVVPEPASLALLAIGGLGLIARRRRA